MNRLLVPKATRTRLARYRADLMAGEGVAGNFLAGLLALRPGALEEDKAFLAALLDTKRPQIFAESEVVGDGSDWTLIELGLLGDLSIAVPVTIFDDGKHYAPTVHKEPLAATLVFTPGALLRNGRGCTPADWDEVVDQQGCLSDEGYNGLYLRRLLPVLQFISDQAQAQGRPALVTIPGLGCGQFAGPFAGQLGTMLEGALVGLLQQQAALLPGIRVVIFDPYKECSNRRREFGGVSFRVRPLRAGNAHRSQLAHPSVHADEGEDFSELALFSVVAWDHVSWPGNDFFAGSRCTDDGVKAAATDVMRVLTGVEGCYDSTVHAYTPPKPFRTWKEVVEQNQVQLSKAVSW